MLRRFLWVSILFALIIAFAVLPMTSSAQQPPRASWFLVGIEDPAQSAEVAAALRDAGLSVEQRFEHVRAIVVSGSLEAVAKARQLSGVRYIEPDAMLASDLPDAELDATWYTKRVEAMVVHQASYKGSGIRFASIDTGINYSHPDLQHPTATRSWQNFTDDGGGSYISQNCPSGVTEHGQRVSGTLIGADNGAGIVGIAPDVDFWMLRVYKYFDPSLCSGYISWVVNAINWAISNNVQVLNIEAPVSTDNQTYHDAIISAVNAGIIVVVPAGNDEGMQYPAFWSEPIVVAAATEVDRNVTGWASGPSVDIAAPGYALYTTEFGGGGYVTVNGSSISSIIVGGVAALHLDQGVPANQVEQKMYNEAYDLLQDGKDNYTGWGMVLADTTRAQFPRGLSSSITTVGALYEVESMVATITFYADGQEIKQKFITLNKAESTGVYLPNEFSASDPGEVVAKVYAAERKFNSQVSTSNSGPTLSEASSVVELSNGSIFGPVVRNSGDRYWTSQTSRIRVIADPDGLEVPVTVYFYDAGGAEVYSYSITIPPKTVYMIPTARIPWNNQSNQLSVRIAPQYGSRWYGGIVETLVDGKRLSDYPLIHYMTNKSFGHRFLHGADQWFSRAHILNAGPSSTVVTMTYHPNASGSDIQYQATVPGYGVVILPPEPYPGTGTEGAIQVTSSGGYIGMVVRTDKFSANATGDYQGQDALGYGGVFTYAALNMWNYYGWYCATPVQNLDTVSKTLTEVFAWPGGSWTPSQQQVDGYHAWPFMNSGLPANVLAGAKAWSGPAGGPNYFVWSGSQCYNNGVGADKAWFAAEGTSMTDIGGPFTRYAAIAYTGKWHD